MNMFRMTNDRPITNAMRKIAQDPKLTDGVHQIDPSESEQRGGVTLPPLGHVFARSLLSRPSKILEVATFGYDIREIAFLGVRLADFKAGLVLPSMNSGASRDPASHLPSGKDRMFTGTVKISNDTGGLGFIQPDEGPADVFVPPSAVDRAGIRNLHEGQRLSYGIVLHPGRGETATASLRAI